LKAENPIRGIIVSFAFFTLLLLICSPALAQQRQYTQQEIDEIVANAVPVPFPDITRGTVNDEPWELVYKYDPKSLPTTMELDQAMEDLTWSAIPGLPGEKSETKGPTQITDTTQYPYSSIVHLYLRFGQYYAGCSGAFVHNNHTVLTAGHCVYSHDSNSYPSEILVIPAENGSNRPFGYIAATNWATNSNWIQYENYRTDWAVILLDAFPGDTGYLGTAYSDKTSWYMGKQFETAGYPGDCGYSGDEMWYGKSTVDEIDNTMLRVDYNFSTYPYYCVPGQSGSSIYYNDGGNYGTTAVLTLASCHGVRINDEIDQTIRTFYCTDGCAIGEQCYNEGETNPDNGCEVCRPSVSQIAWTLSDEGTTCDDGQWCTTDDVCFSGLCIGSARDCDDGQYCNGPEICNEVTMTCVSAGNPCDGDCSESAGSYSCSGDDDDDDGGSCGC